MRTKFRGTIEYCCSLIPRKLGGLLPAEVAGRGFFSCSIDARFMLCCYRSYHVLESIVGIQSDHYKATCRQPERGMYTAVGDQPALQLSQHCAPYNRHD